MALTVSSPQWGISSSASLSGTTAPLKLNGSITHAVSKTYVVGSSSGQVQKSYSADLSINSSGATSLDLTTLTWPDGTALSFSAISTIIITNLSTTASQNLTIGGGTNGLFAALPFTLDSNTLTTTSGTNVANAETIVIGKNAGITVDSTHKILTLAVSSGSAVPVRVTIHGR